MDVMKPNPGRVCSLEWNAARRAEEPCLGPNACVPREYYHPYADEGAAGEMPAVAEVQRPASPPPPPPPRRGRLIAIFCFCCCCCCIFFWFRDL